MSPRVERRRGPRRLDFGDLCFVVPPPIPPDNVHALAQSDDAYAAPRLGLSSLDKLSLEALVAGDVAGVAELARGLAEALAGPDQDQVRLRTLARAIAIARTQQSLLEAMLIERLAKRDAGGVELVDRVLRGLVGRLVKLTDAHRLESSQQRRVAVHVGHADHVTVEGAG